jgi:hypothetical protein
VQYFYRESVIVLSCKKNEERFHQSYTSFHIFSVGGSGDERNMGQSEIIVLFFGEKCFVICFTQK